MTSRPALVFFDFDGTITPRDSFLEFIKYTHGSARLGWCLLANAPLILLYFLGLYPNDRLKERFFSFFYKGSRAADLQQQGDEFGRDFLPSICFPQAMQTIRWHQKQGHEIYLLTASSAIWLAQWCRDQGIELIGTEMRIVEGVLVGKIEGKNCHGAEKLRRIEHLLEEERTVYGYGDSSSDRFYLDVATHRRKGPLSVLPNWVSDNSDKSS